MLYHQVFICFVVVLLIWVMYSNSKYRSCRCGKGCRYCAGGRHDMCHVCRQKRRGCGCDTMKRGPPGYNAGIYSKHDVRLRWGLRPPPWVDPTWNYNPSQYPQSSMPKGKW